MTAEHGERKLAAILAADVVGFSKLASTDEDRTLARLRALRSDLIDPTIAVHRGRVVKRTGDGAIVEFRSAVDAVNCAIEIQEAMLDRNAGVPQDRRIVFRIGVHVGDVVQEPDGDLMGDGINIAARLEGIAEAGGVCLSAAAHDQVPVGSATFWRNFRYRIRLPYFKRRLENAQRSESATQRQWRLQYNCNVVAGSLRSLL